MEFFLLYLKSRKYPLCFILFSAAVFLASFLLYHLPTAALIYPLLLILCFGSIFWAADFLRCRKKTKLLSQIDADEAALSVLPECDCPEEAAYRSILQKLVCAHTEKQEQHEQQYENMMEYYTLWAHQIKTPISAMHLALQGEDSELSRSLSSELFHIEQYADMVLAYLRLDCPTSDYVFRKQPIDPIIRSCIRRFAPEFIGRKIMLNYTPAGLQAVTDEKWLAFVIEQLLSNALKYTRTGSIRIFSPKNDVLCIEDTGIGIAPEDLPRIFEPGFTGVNGRADKKASGIGLYLCRLICARLSIRITAESQPGRGSCFYLFFSQYDLHTE